MYMGLSICSKNTRIWQCSCFLLDIILIRGIKKKKKVMFGLLVLSFELSI